MRNIKFYAIVLIFSLNSCKSKKKIIQVEKTSIEETYINESQNLTLPFTIIYGGPLLKKTNLEILKKGYTHIARGGIIKSVREQLDPKNRALLWTGLAYIVKDQPWNEIKSPWGNDLNKYNSRWKHRLKSYANYYNDNSEIPNVDILILDIEAERISDKSILTLKSNNEVPIEIRKLNNTAFINKYKIDMVNLSNEPYKLVKNIKKLSSYGVVPFKRNWHGLEKQSFEELTEERNLAYNALPAINNKRNPYFNNTDFLTPSSYFFYKRPQNLAYALMQVEANMLTSNKDVILFHSPRYVGSINHGQLIDVELSEYMSIFPFFSGAKGIWLYEDSKFRKGWKIENLEVYLAFNKGLKRLSNFNNILEKNYQVFIPKNAREHFVDKDPIWRAIVTSDEILVAACNPYAKENEETEINIKYKRFQKTISVKGKELFLESFTLK